eukprot:scaffold2142_cov67-Skeletonema_dohrnii-CCMP3373.AAC.1
MHDAHRAATKTGSLSEDSGLYRCYHEKGVVKDSFVSSRHIFSVCDDGCFAFVDVGGSVQRLKCQQAHLAPRA